jgi:hypothetical protein
MYQRREYSEHEKIQIGFKASGKLVDATHEAAKHARYESTSKYLHDLVRDAVAAELGVSAASLEPDAKPARAGVTVKDASPELAAQVAQLNAGILDMFEKLKQVQALANAPAAKPVTRRR